MAKYEDIKNNCSIIYKCDECKKTFKSSEIKLEPAKSNIKIINFHMPFLFISKDGMIMGGNFGPDPEKGDQILTCPHCGFPHLFGFDPST